MSSTPLLVLGLETSCDETAAAVVEVDPGDGPGGTPPRGRVRSDVIHTQAAVHARFGGVVPELASRDHLQRALPVVDEALARAGCTLAQLDGLAVTRGPGLVGALLVGLQVAKGLAAGAGKPLVGVHHLEGHLLAALLAESPPPLPFLGLVVSGGHTSLYEVREVPRDGPAGPEAPPFQYRALGRTLDDAAGEAFDKGAKLLGLPYPGGVQIDRLARVGDRNALPFPRGLSTRRKDQFDFSFSGLKTALRVHLQKAHPAGPPEDRALADCCASYQEAICDSLTRRAVRAARAARLPRLVLCGGVAANSRLRSLALERCGEEGLDLFLPPPRLCTDNGAMIALAGGLHLARGARLAAGATADPAWRLDP
jgi:N6-L-threonylcarbamoyladenine synthase